MNLDALRPNIFICCLRKIPTPKLFFAFLTVMNYIRS